MIKPKSMLTLLKRSIVVLSFTAFSFLFFSVAASVFLYAEITVRDLEPGTESVKVVWREENGKLIIVERDELKLGEVIPDTCRICIVTGRAVLEVQGEDMVLRDGEFLNGRDSVVKKGQRTYVKVSEGGVSYQEEIIDAQQRKPIGDPIPINTGKVLLRLNDCYTFEEMAIEEFEGADLVATPPILSPQGSETPPCQPTRTTTGNVTPTTTANC